MTPKSTGEIIKALRQGQGLSQTELARLMGYNDRTTIAKLEMGTNQLPEQKLPQLARILGVTEDYLRNSLERQLYALDVEIEYRPGYVHLRDGFTGHEISYTLAAWQQLKLDNDFRTVWEALDTVSGNTLLTVASRLSPAAARAGRLYDRAVERDRRLVDAVLESYDDGSSPEPAMPESAPGPRLLLREGEDGFQDLSVFEEAAAAGFGNYLDAPVPHAEQYPPGVVPAGTDFGVRISGDSMEPRIRNGATAFVRARVAIEPGEIGIFVLNGQSYCKKLIVDYEKREVRLRSLNPRYPDIPVSGGDELRTLGRVLDSYPR